MIRSVLFVVSTIITELKKYAEMKKPNAFLIDEELQPFRFTSYSCVFNEIAKQVEGEFEFGEQYVKENFSKRITMMQNPLP